MIVLDHGGPSHRLVPDKFGELKAAINGVWVSPDRGPGGLRRGESFDHCRMKHTLREYIPDVILEPEDFLEGRRPDAKIGGVAIECQLTPIRLKEWRQRLSEYSAAKRPMLWIWALRYITGEREDLFSDLCRQQSYPVPRVVRVCHDESYGRVFVMDGLGEMHPVYLAGHSRARRILFNDPDSYDPFVFTTKSGMLMAGFL